MTQSVVIQVGQCGNQIGCRFWNEALKEHACVNKTGVYDESMSSFFRNVDSRCAERLLDIPIGNSKGKIRSLKARAVLIDMEEGVVSEMLKGPLRDVFDHQQLITDVSGCGNNWAVGYHTYSSQYYEQISDIIRQSAEACDSLACFFILHSMGGGTGSGLGTYVLSMLADQYPDVYRFVTAVFPSADDDVITSSYNSVLAMTQLTDHADCVLPVENQALIDIVNKQQQSKGSESQGKRTYGVQRKKIIEPQKEKETAFDSVNNIVANLMLNMTSSSRFDGSLNVDLNEISMNLVPFPKLHYLVASQAPLYSTTRKLDVMFSDAFSRDHQLLATEPKRGLYLACALMVRGNVQVSDIRRNIERLKPSLDFVYWNTEGWKTGLCNVPPVGQTHSLLMLANNTCITKNFGELRDRFVKLYKRKAHIHHYERVEGFESLTFSESLESLSSVIQEYGDLEKQTRGATTVPRLKIV